MKSIPYWVDKFNYSNMQRRTNQENTKDIYHLQEAVTELKDHAKTSNLEMGEVKNTLGSVETKLQWFEKEAEWLKSMIEKLDGKIWWVLTTIIIGGIVQILINLLK